MPVYRCGSCGRILKKIPPTNKCPHCGGRILYKVRQETVRTVKAR
ncbi:MAG: DNA-directed RNA polymerase subunit P [Candidatus Hadarchaeota archaeon]|nr:DNA-directed RNA polymerase subunit P [Candidatus Hadarchaeota archaeon]